MSCRQIEISLSKYFATSRSCFNRSMPYAAALVTTISKKSNYERKYASIYFEQFHEHKICLRFLEALHKLKYCEDHIH